MKDSGTRSSFATRCRRRIVVLKKVPFLEGISLSGVKAEEIKKPLVAALIAGWGFEPTTLGLREPKVPAPTLHVFCIPVGARLEPKRAVETDICYLVATQIYHEETSSNQERLDKAACLIFHRKKSCSCRIDFSLSASADTLPAASRII